MQVTAVIDHIVEWLGDYCRSASMSGFVVGVSGGIDSALTSTLCAKTGLPVTAISMPIYQDPGQLARADDHLAWLTANYANVSTRVIDLTPVFASMEQHFPADIQDDLSMANTRSRLRMTTLYAVAGHQRGLVAGTGNKVEDFGVGFYTKYGDGGVDVSPIADLMKTEVRALASALDVIPSILQAAPTDGLWGDERSDEDQLGASYPELEWAMGVDSTGADETGFDERQREVLAIYRRLHRANRHKMVPIPVCEIPPALRD